MAKQEQSVPKEAEQQEYLAERVQKPLGEVNAAMEMLRTEADRARGIAAAFGFGRRILVPPDEIHVVSGDGWHSFTLSKERKVFGQTAGRPSYYWLNPLTQVIKLKTISFTVPLRGVEDGGIEALDNSKVSFLLWAHAVAKLNPDKADIAAQRVGLDASSLINTITEVGTAELIAAAATMDLEKIIASRQKLAEIAFPQVNQILSELGYDLALLTITKLDGIAYHKLVEQAEARVSKEASIATNREQIAELQDDQARERTEAEVKAETEKKLAAERLEAQREVEIATLSQQETLAVRRHELQVEQIKRQKVEAGATHEAELAEVQLNEQLSQAEAEKEAKLARLKAERQAELRAMQQKRNAEISLAETEAEAERAALDQIRQIERNAERTEAEAKRLRAEELAAAERAKEVALLEANQLGEALKVEAEAESRSLQIKAEAETNAELIRAEAEATATEKRAQAAKIRAEATRAEVAAQGLAETEVEEAKVQVAEKQVAVTRAEGLAGAEIDRAKAAAEAERLQQLKKVEIEAEKKFRDVEINAKKEMLALYDQSPVLVDMEKIRMQFEHNERVLKMQTDAYLEAFRSIAPGVRVHIYGNGGQANQIITDLLSLSQGVHHLGEEIPAVEQLLQGNGAGVDIAREFNQFVPYLRQVLADVNPRMFSSLKIADVVERLEPVVAGQQDLATALADLKQDAHFRVVGDMPIAPVLRLFGINLPEGAGMSEDVGIADLVDDEDEAAVEEDAEERR